MMRRPLLFIYILLEVAICTGRRNPCLQPCYCHTAHGIKQFDCSKVRFNHIPLITKDLLVNDKEYWPDYSVNLMGNNISDISSKELKKLFGGGEIYWGSKLTGLNLYKNPISKISWDAFKIAKSKLGSLNVSATSVSEGAFIDLPELIHLGLDGNVKLTEIKFGTFSSLKKLKTLIIKNTKIQKLIYGMFSGLASIEEIDVSGNQIEMIEKGVFSEHSKLKKLTLSGNRLSDFQSVDLSGLVVLTELNMSHNQITQFNSTMLKGIASLQSFDISNNQLEEFKDELSNLDSLEYFYIGSNNWNNINVSLLSDLSSIKLLDLTSNQIKEFDDRYISRKLDKLEKLVLKHNNISTLSVRNTGRYGRLNIDLSESRNCFDNLTIVLPLMESATLDMSKGCMKKLPNFNREWQGKVYFRGFQLQENEFTNLTLDNIGVQVLNVSLNKLNYVYVGNKCTVRGILDISRNNISSLLIEDGAYMWFLNASHNSLEHLPEKALPRPSYDQLHKDIRSVEIIDFSHNIIKTISENTFINNRKYLKRIYLDHNNLTMLDSSFDRLKYLKLLDISHNNIKSIQNNVFETEDPNLNIESNLERLYLQSNLIEHLNGLLWHLDGLRYLDLSNNLLRSIAEQDFMNKLKYQQLDEINLSYNGIATFTARSCKRNQPLLAVRILHLRKNNFTVLSDQFNELRQLKVLDLSDNLIDNIEPNALTKNKLLKSLILINNSLKSLPDNFLQSAVSVEKIFLSGNKITCSCSVIHAVNKKNDASVFGACLPLNSTIPVPLIYLRNTSKLTFETNNCNLCPLKPCGDRGMCQPNASTGYTCKCYPRYVGNHCEVSYHECVKVQKCGICTDTLCNNSTCLETSQTTFACKCKPGFFGISCEKRVCNKDENICKNNGNCSIALKESPKCQCQTGFSGQYCELNACISNKCQNNATCTLNDKKEIKCVCKPGFSGKYCEEVHATCEAYETLLFNRKIVSSCNRCDVSIHFCTSQINQTHLNLCTCKHITTGIGLCLKDTIRTGSRPCVCPYPPKSYSCQNQVTQPPLSKPVDRETSKAGSITLLHLVTYLMINYMICKIWGMF